MTREETENRIEDARIRREMTSQEAVLRRVEPKMRRSQKQHVRQTYLSQMADKRHKHLKQVYLSQMARVRQGHEEAIVLETQQNIRRIREREASRQSMVAEVDETSERDASTASRASGMEFLAQMNGDLEQLIRNVYAKMKAEQE